MKQVMTALITPFHEDGSVDFGSLRALVHDQLQAGIDGFIVCGTTGETPTLTMEEKEAVIDCVLHECGGRVPVYAGAGTNCTATTIAAICRLEKYPLSGYLLVTPYYSRPSEEGLFRHFQAACALTHKPVMLYHVPKRTASRISVALLRALLKACPNIRAVKYADRCYEEVLALRRTVPGFQLFSGDDDSCFDAMQEGMDGVISVISHLVPRAMKQAAEQPDEELVSMLRKLAALCFIESSPAPLKYLMAREERCSNVLRLPLCPLSERNAAVLEEQFWPLYDNIRARCMAQ